MPTTAGDDPVTGLADVVDELYVLAPENFVVRRDALATAARSAGDKTLAAAVRRLKRPTTSAWALNLLSRQESDLVGELLALGESMRRAQAGLDGAALRELDKQRRAVVGALARQAAVLAAEHGHRLDAELSRQVEQSLGAALADPDVGAAVASGQLTQAVSVVGFGVEVDPDAVAVPALVLVGARRRRHRSSGPGDARPPAPVRRTTSATSPGRATGRPPGSLDHARARRKQEQRDDEREARRTEARATLEAARATEAEARRSAEQAATRVADLRARLDELTAEREELVARLAGCDEHATRATTRLTEQEQQQDDADLALVAARRATRRAERALEEAETVGRP